MRGRSCGSVPQRSSNILSLSLLLKCVNPRTDRLRMNIFALLAFNTVLFFASPALPQTQSLGPKDTFAAARLSAKEIHEIVEGVEPSAYDTPDSWNKELRVRRVDLGGSPGIVVQGSKLLCGGTGNCQTWVFRKANNKWVSLFRNEQAPIAESFQLGPAVTHNIKDFEIVTNSSAGAGERVTYKFDGMFYRIVDLAHGRKIRRASATA
jgi:hypothetical protein